MKLVCLFVCFEAVLSQDDDAYSHVPPNSEAVGGAALLQRSVAAAPVAVLEEPRSQVSVLDEAPNPVSVLDDQAESVGAKTSPKKAKKEAKKDASNVAMKDAHAPAMRRIGMCYNSEGYQGAPECLSAEAEDENKQKAVWLLAERVRAGLLDFGSDLGLLGVEGVGSSAPLDAAGFKAATSECCPMEMERFFSRLLDSKGLDTCSWPHIQGLMHWFTCVPDMDFQYVLNVIDLGNPCKYWAPKGEACPQLSPECEGNFCKAGATTYDWLASGESDAAAAPAAAEAAPPPEPEVAPAPPAPPAITNPLEDPEPEEAAPEEPAPTVPETTKKPKKEKPTTPEPTTTKEEEETTITETTTAEATTTATTTEAAVQPQAAPVARAPRAKPAAAAAAAPVSIQPSSASAPVSIQPAQPATLTLAPLDEETTQPPETTTETTTATTTLTTTMTTTTNTICQGDVALKFWQAKRTHSNLGGMGPDDGDESMRLSNLGNFNGEDFDLILKSTTSRYVTKKTHAQYNGVYGFFGYLTMKIDSGADFKFTIVKAGTNTPMVLPKFFFTLFDLDSGNPNDPTMGEEIVTAGGFDKYIVPPDTELDIKEDGKGNTIFRSTVYGTGADNPSDPHNMTPQQRSRAVTFQYTDASEFEITYDLSPGSASPGRDVYFAGRSQLTELECDADLMAQHT